MLDYECITEKYRKILKQGGQIVVLDIIVSGMSMVNKFKLPGWIIKGMGTEISLNKNVKKNNFSTKDMQFLLKDYGFKVGRSDLIGAGAKAVLAIGLKQS